MDWAIFFGPGSIPVITAIVAGIKRLLPAQMPDSYLPAVSVAVGIAWNVWIAHLLVVGLQDAATQGFLYGLAAAGLYTAGKIADRAMA